MAEASRREYLGWQDAANIDWKVQKEAEGRVAWKRKWGELMELHDKWARSDIHRVYRKPSYESLEWLAWQRKFEVPQVGEWMARHDGVKMGNHCPLTTKPCKPQPWPRTTYGEVGWLGQQKDCQLEIYDTKYNRKPPLPWYMTKISARPVY